MDAPPQVRSRRTDLTDLRDRLRFVTVGPVEGRQARQASVNTGEGGRSAHAGGASPGARLLAHAGILLQQPSARNRRNGLFPGHGDRWTSDAHPGTHARRVSAQATGGSFTASTRNAKNGLLSLTKPQTGLWVFRCERTLDERLVATEHFTAHDNGDPCCSAAGRTHVRSFDGTDWVHCRRLSCTIERAAAA